MAISTTTFEERLGRINKREAKAENTRQRQRSRVRPRGLMIFASLGMLIGGAAFAWDGNAPPYEWALPGLEWAMSLLP